MHQQAYLAFFRQLFAIGHDKYIAIVQKPIRWLKSRYLVTKEEISIPNPNPKTPITRINKGKKR
jgi:hypothetical protein